MIWIILSLLYVISIFTTRYSVIKIAQTDGITLKFGHLLLCFLPVVNTCITAFYFLECSLWKIITFICKLNLVEEFFKPREFGTAVRFQIGLVLLFTIFITILIIKFYNTYS